MRRWLRDTLWNISDRLCSRRHDQPGQTAEEDMKQAWREIFDVVKSPGAALKSRPLAAGIMAPDTGKPDEPSDLGAQLAAFADEVREWAELDLAAGLEGWPDDDWPDL